MPVLIRPIFLALAVFYALACEKTEKNETPLCAVGSTRSCSGAEACVGTQTCTGVPAAYGTCTCAVPLTLGQACQSDGDCASPAFCLTRGANNFFGGGSAIGVCVADCTEDGTACSKFAQAECVSVAMGAANKSLCFAACEVGAESSGKCHARDNVICDRVPGQSGVRGFCRPICQLDSDCGTRSCDRQQGVCVDAARPADTFGKSCDPAMSLCEGLCLSLVPEYSVCSHRCKFGQTLDCQNATEPTGACTFTSTLGTLADTGFCGQLCDCNARCSHSNAVCDPFANADLEQTFGKLGVCAPSALAQAKAGLVACP